MLAQTELDSQPQELAARADAEAQPAAVGGPAGRRPVGRPQDLAGEPVGAGAAAPPTEEQDAGTVALEQTAPPEVSTEPLADTSLGEEGTAHGVPTLPCDPGWGRLTSI